MIRASLARIILLLAALSVCDSFHLVISRALKSGPLRSSPILTPESTPSQVSQNPSPLTSTSTKRDVADFVDFHAPVFDCLREVLAQKDGKWVSSLTQKWLNGIFAGAENTGKRISGSEFLRMRDSEQGTLCAVLLVESPYRVSNPKITLLWFSFALQSLRSASFAFAFTSLTFSSLASLDSLCFASLLSHHRLSSFARFISASQHLLRFSVLASSLRFGFSSLYLSSLKLASLLFRPHPSPAPSGSAPPELKKTVFINYGSEVSKRKFDKGSFKQLLANSGADCLSDESTGQTVSEFEELKPDATYRALFFNYSERESAKRELNRITNNNHNRALAQEKEVCSPFDCNCCLLLHISIYSFFTSDSTDEQGDVDAHAKRS
jgi:hypothetical protein